MELEEGDVVLCTVERIVGTTVFVRMHLNREEPEGSITFSEISPGRIRNIRDYVVPKKKIVCKVLRISGKSMELSYRRVTQDERKEVLEKWKKEKSYENMLKSILGEEKAKESIQKIRKENTLYEFFQEAKDSSQKLKKIMSEKEAEKILSILKEEKQKTTRVRKEISLKTSDENGLELIKKTLGSIGEGVKITYLSGGRYVLEKESENAKEADNLLQGMLSDIEKNSKKHELEFSILQK